MMPRFLWVSIVVLVLDQLSKLAAVAWLSQRPPVNVLPFFDLVMVHNTGAAFGLLNDAGGWQNLLFIVIALIFSIGIIVIVRLLAAKDAQVALALMLVLGGAVGNLIDRVRLGYVIDFLDFYYGRWHWPAFNVADSAITIGAALLILDALGMHLLGGHKAVGRTP